MKAHRAEFPLAAMCRVLGLSPSGYYAWLKRPASARARRDDELQDKIQAIWTGSGETYGRPRIHAALRAEGERVGQKRVGPADEGDGDRGRDQEALQDGDDEEGHGGPARAGPGEAGLLGLGARPAVGGRHHVRAHVGGLAVSGRRARRLEPPRRRLGHGDAHADRAGRGRAGDGPRAPPPRRARRPSFGSRLAVHLARLRGALPRVGHRAVDGLGGRRVRQRHVRELLRDAGVRTHLAALVPHRGRGTARGVRLHRRLLQHAQASLRPRLRVAPANYERNHAA